MAAVKEDHRLFLNPKDHWAHEGTFSVELTDDADMRVPLRNAKVEGNLITIEKGRVEEERRGIQFFSEGQVFSWPRSKIKVIRDGYGRLLWVNYRYR